MNTDDKPNAVQAALAARHVPARPQSDEPLTDAEIEALARFLHDADPPTTLSFDALVKGDRAAMERAVRETFAEGSNYTTMLRAALDMIRRLVPPDTLTLSRAEAQTAFDAIGCTKPTDERDALLRRLLAFVKKEA